MKEGEPIQPNEPNHQRPQPGSRNEFVVNRVHPTIIPPVLGRFVRVEYDGTDPEDGCHITNSSELPKQVPDNYQQKLQQHPQYIHEERMRLERFARTTEGITLKNDQFGRHVNFDAWLQALIDATRYMLTEQGKDTDVHIERYLAIQNDYREKPFALLDRDN